MDNVDGKIIRQRKGAGVHLLLVGVRDWDKTVGWVLTHMHKKSLVAFWSDRRMWTLHGTLDTHTCWLSEATIPVVGGASPPPLPDGAALTSDKLVLMGMVSAESAEVAALACCWRDSSCN